MEIVAYQRGHLEAILALAEGVAFSTLVEDPERAHRALSGPGSVSLVALDGGEPIGFAHTITDGEIQAYLCRLLVSPAHQRRGRRPARGPRRHAGDHPARTRTAGGGGPVVAAGAESTRGHRCSFERSRGTRV